MATIQRINIIGSREGSRNRRRLKANQTGKKFRVGIKSNISTNRNNLISGVDRCIHLNAMDECSRLLEASTMKSRRGFAIQRLMNAMRQAHADGWFIVFDTLTLADDRLEAFYDNPNALRDYFRDIGRMVLAAEGRKANDSHADCYQY